MFMIQELTINRKSARNDPVKATVDIKQYRCLEEYKLKNGGFNPKKNNFDTQRLGDDIMQIIELPILQKVVTVTKDGTLYLYEF